MNEMTDEPHIKYLCCDMRLSRYKAMQMAIISGLGIGGVAAFVFLRGFDRWYFQYLWLICLVVLIAEIIETAIAIKKHAYTSSEAHNSNT